MYFIFDLISYTCLVECSQYQIGTNAYKSKSTTDVRVNPLPDENSLPFPDLRCYSNPEIGLPLPTPNLEL